MYRVEALIHYYIDISETDKLKIHLEYIDGKLHLIQISRVLVLSVIEQPVVDTYIHVNNVKYDVEVSDIHRVKSSRYYNRNIEALLENLSRYLGEKIYYKITLCGDH